MVTQTVAKSVNKGIVLGFALSTAGTASTAVITATQIALAGGKTIRSIHLKCTGGDGWLGLGKTAVAATTPTKDLVPIFQNGFFDWEHCSYATLNMIRVSGNITVTGFVVVN